jgi:hypothetical protein
MFSVKNTSAYMDVTPMYKVEGYTSGCRKLVLGEI